MFLLYIMLEPRALWGYKITIAVSQDKYSVLLLYFIIIIIIIMTSLVV